MPILTREKLRVSGLSLASNLKDSDYTRRKRTIWTPDGEYQIPQKKRAKSSILRASVTDIWFKDEKGKLLMYDKYGEHNTITNGAIFDMMEFMFGHTALQGQYGAGWGLYGPNTANNSVANNSSGFGVTYNDGSYNFPNMNNILSYYNGASTFWAPIDLWNPAYSLFGIIAFLNGSSAGLTGSHIPPSVTMATGFYTSPNSAVGGPATGTGWNNVTPTTPWSTTQTTLSDSFTTQASAVPQMSHAMTLTAGVSAKQFTFDGIAWLPMGYDSSAAPGVASSLAPGLYTGGGGLVPSFIAPTWASANVAPSSVTNLMVSALWNPGYLVTLNPNGTWGFTYTFQG